MKNEACVDPPALSPEGGEGRERPSNGAVVICRGCGQVFELTGRKRHFCSKQCNNRYNSRKQYREAHGDPEQRRENVCLYNEGVDCAGGECSKCGWNPAVAKARLDGKQVAGCLR